MSKRSTDKLTTKALQAGCLRLWAAWARWALCHGRPFHGPGPQSLPPSVRSLGMAGPIPTCGGEPAFLWLRGARPGSLPGACCSPTPTRSHPDSRSVFCNSSHPRVQLSGRVQRMCWPSALSTPVVRNWGQLCLQNLAVSGDAVGCQDWGERGATGISCAEGSDAARLSPRHGAAPPHPRITQMSAVLVRNPACSTAVEMSLFSIPQPEAHFPTRASCWIIGFLSQNTES